MDFTLIFSFVGASILLTLMPGPDILLVVTESITNGKKNGLALAIGLCAGVLVHTFAAATGLSLIIQSSELAFNVLKYLGAGYLFYLAVLAMKESADVTKIEKGEEEKKALFGLTKKGFLMNVLNPKVSLFFIAFLPQFVTKGGYAIGVQMFVLGVIFMVQALVVFGLVALLAGQLREYLNSSKFWQIAKWGKVFVLFMLGVLLLLSS